MDCRQFKQWLHEHDARMGAADPAHVADHVDRCPACRQLLTEVLGSGVTNDRNAFSALPLVAPPAHVLERVLADLPTHGGDAVPTPSLFEKVLAWCSRSLVPVGVATLVVLLSASVLWHAGSLSTLSMPQATPDTALPTFLAMNAPESPDMWRTTTHTSVTFLTETAEPMVGSFLVDGALHLADLITDKSEHGTEPGVGVTFVEPESLPTFFNQSDEEDKYNG